MMRCQPALGTYVEIFADTTDELVSAQAMASAFDAIQTVQRHMSVFDPNSDVSQINAGHYVAKPCAVHPWVWDVLSLSVRIHQLCPSFDITQGHALVAQGLRPALQTSHASQMWGGMADLTLLPNHQVQTTQPIYLDLGGIAKGYAVDRAVDAIQAQGVVSGYVNAGGDLRVFGAYAHEVYLRACTPPHAAIQAGVLQDAAMATSGDYFVRDAAKGVVGHLVDPLVNQPIASEQSYTVIAPQCATADALTKIFAITKDPQHPAITAMGGIGLEVLS